VQQQKSKMPPKFGLIKMQGFAKGQGLKGPSMKAAAAPKANPLKAAAALGFGGGDSDGDDEDVATRAQERSRAAARGIDVRGVNADLLRQQAASSVKVAKLQAQAVAEGGDAVFAYDEVRGALWILARSSRTLVPLQDANRPNLASRREQLKRRHPKTNHCTALG
jgi:hypothetical protein